MNIHMHAYAWEKVQWQFRKTFDRYVQLSKMDNSCNVWNCSCRHAATGTYCFQLVSVTNLIMIKYYILKTKPDRTAVTWVIIEVVSAYGNGSFGKVILDIGFYHEIGTFISTTVPWPVVMVLRFYVRRWNCVTLNSRLKFWWKMGWISMSKRDTWNNWKLLRYPNTKIQDGYPWPWVILGYTIWSSVEAY